MGQESSRRSTRKHTGFVRTGQRSKNLPYVSPSSRSVNNILSISFIKEKLELSLEEGIFRIEQEITKI